MGRPGWHFGVLDGPGSSEPGHTTASAWGSTSAVVYGSQLHVFSGTVTSVADSDIDFESLRQDWWDGARWHFGILDQGTPCQSSSVCVDADEYGASIVSVVYNGQLHVFSDEYTLLGLVYEAPAVLQHDWRDGTRWNHTSQLGRLAIDSVWPDPDNAVTVYNGQLHVFTFLAGSLADVWWR